MTLMILLLYLAFFDYLPNMQWTRYDRKLSLTLILLGLLHSKVGIYAKTRLMRATSLLPRNIQASTRRLSCGPVLSFLDPLTKHFIQDIINLARETNVPSLLPAAFYDISRYTFSQIFEPLDDEPSRFRGAAAGGTLSADDMRRLALGKEASAHAVGAVIHAMGRGPLMHSRKGAFSLQSHPSAPHAVTVCATPGACRRDFAELVALATQHYVCDRERGYADPLYVAEELGALKSADVSECRACARALEVWAAKERERMWKMIPLWFRLDS